MFNNSAMASFKTAESGRKQKDIVMSNLKDVFGTVLHLDIIRSVAVQCNYDVQRSSDVLAEMTRNIDIAESQAATKKKNKANKKASPQHSTPKKNALPPRLQASSSTGNVVVTKSKKALEMDRVVKNIRQGYKVLVILRGLPGSGKSRLAVAITDVTLGPGTNSHHVLSTDDFFVQHRGYVFEANRLQEAHEWNQRRAFEAMSRGVSPVIIDNTNTQMWEMKPYAMMAVDYGYIIEILEPDTWWCFNEKELAKRNIHGVARAKIKDMLDRYEKNVTRERLLLAYNLTYKFQKPPQYRLIPPLVRNGFTGFGYNPAGLTGCNPTSSVDGILKSKSTTVLNRQPSTCSNEAGETINLMDFTEEPPSQDNSRRPSTDCFATDPVDEILMCTEENGSSDVLQPAQVDPNQEKKEASGSFPDIENAWGVDEKALQSWDIVAPIECDVAVPSVSSSTDGGGGGGEGGRPETKEVGCNVDVSDYLRDGAEVPAGCRVVAARGRDINTDSPAIRMPMPSKKLMKDRSCVTEDDPVEEVAGSEEGRIQDLVDLFPRIPRSALRELFNKCNKNFHWTVDLLLEDNHLEFSDKQEEGEEEEGESVEEKVQQSSNFDVIDWEGDGRDKEVKVFKRKTVSEDALELKRCLEEKIDINKEHYSEHVLRVKQSKFGGHEDPRPSTSAAAAAVESESSDEDSEGDEDNSSDDDPKNMIELNLGENFVEQLETMFGGGGGGGGDEDGLYPKGFQPVVQIPMALARQIYSFYVESVCQQMEAQNHILDRLVKEDEEFARKLQRQEEEAAVQRPPPTLMEIMDEQVALNMHKKDVDEWKNMTADDLAARLTKQKLFSAFPNLDKESLVEIWHAYGYDYNKTVADLMASVGPDHMNGSREAIEEPPLSSSTLQEMKEAEENCEELEETEEAQPATYYREQANKHLRNREQLYEKAKGYYQRGMTEVAMFYSELAKKETQLYDKANHIAAVAFIEEHSKRLQKFDTLDLHYFYVKEAMENLDIFIDRNINLLKGGSKKSQDLFVITGRGKNSEGGRSKIKPAVISRLKKRKISFVPLNPGLLKIKVLKNSLMTSDLP